MSCCDGTFVNGTINGQPVWQTTASAGYLYFSIPASLNAVAGQPLYVAVQYYDTGYNKLGYQYDSTQGAFFPPEVTAHSSLVNTNTFATSYFAMKTPTLQKQENGGNDFRIYGTNGSVSIASVSIQKTPFSDATFQLALTTPWLTTYPGSTADASTLQGKTMAGYQGWFSCPNDLNDQGWIHWSNTLPFTVMAGFPTWPDVSFYPANSQYAGARCQADNLLTQSGKQAYVYSSANPDVIAQHFSWMQQNNIDGVWVQRFLGGGNVPGTHPEWVLAGVRKEISETPRAKTRVLTDHELAAMLTATTDGSEYSDIVRVLLHTGMRKGEVASLQPRDLDFEARTIKVRPEVSKTKYERVIPMDKAIVPLLVMRADLTRRDAFIFGVGSNFMRPFSGWGNCTDRLRGAMPEGDSWTMHDIRRTVATRLHGQGVDPLVIEDLLGHLGGARGGMAGVYNRSVTLAKQASALREWAAKLASLLGDNVIPLEPGRAQATRQTR